MKTAEFIVVDDGSTDGSGEICDEYKNDSRFRIFHKENGGVSSARNYGINKARGQYLTFLDADDEYPAGALYLMNRLKKGNITSFNHLRQIGNNPPRISRYLSAGTYNLYKRQTCWWGVWNKLYKTSFIKDNNIRFDEEVNFGEDELFNLECLLIEKSYKHFATITLIRHFDDKESLVHALGPKGVLEQYNGLIRVRNRLQAEGASEKDINVPIELMNEHETSALYLRILDNHTPEEYINERKRHSLHSKGHSRK